MKKNKTTKIALVMSVMLVVVTMIGFGTSALADIREVYETEENIEINPSIPTVTLREDENGSFSAVVTDQNNEVIFQESGISLDQEATIEYLYNTIPELFMIIHFIAAKAA